MIYHLQVNGDKLKMYTINSEPPLKKVIEKVHLKKNFLNPKEDRKKDQRTDEISRKQILIAR